MQQNQKPAFEIVLPNLFGHYSHIQLVFHLGFPSLTFQNELSWSFHGVVFAIQTPMIEML